MRLQQDFFEIVNRKKRYFLLPHQLCKKRWEELPFVPTLHMHWALNTTGNPSAALRIFQALAFTLLKILQQPRVEHSHGARSPGSPTKKIYHKLQLFSLHGQSREAYEKDQIGSWEYDIVGTWYKCNMTDIAAALGLSQLKNYDKKLVRRKEIIEKYDAAFHKLGIMTLEHF